MSHVQHSLRDRQRKAIEGLTDGSLTITLTRQTEAEIRALVKNGDGIEYGVTLTEHGAFCSCKDALYRGGVCKHAVATCVFCLQHTEPADDRIHLMWSNGGILCGATAVKRFWQNWTLNALNWSDLMCQPCVHAWTHPAEQRGEF
jgi:predicted ABC-type ATPase